MLLVHKKQKLKAVVKRSTEKAVLSQFFACIALFTSSCPHSDLQYTHQHSIVVVEAVKTPP